jgi:hypothetical protein
MRVTVAVGNTTTGTGVGVDPGSVQAARRMINKVRQRVRIVLVIAKLLQVGDGQKYFLITDYWLLSYYYRLLTI